MLRILPLRINIRDSLVLVLLVIFNTIHVTDLGKDEFSAYWFKTLNYKFNTLLFYCSK